MERNSNKGLKKLVLLLLLFVGLGASVTAGAYWASSFTLTLPDEATGTVTVEVGEGGVVIVTTALTPEITGDDDKLIPSTMTPGEGETNTKSFEVAATWSTETAGTVGIVQSGTISISAVISAVSKTDVSYTGEDDPFLAADKALFTVTVTPESGTIQLGQEHTFTVTVTMTEPANEAQYDRVANANITITFKLEVVL